MKLPEEVAFEAFRNVDGTVTIVTKLTSFEFLNMAEKQAKQYMNELLAKSVKMAVMEFYPQIQAEVDALIHTKETREMIEQVIKKKIEETVNQHIKDMFGNA